MIPLLALKSGAKVAQRGLARLVATVGKKPLLAGAAGFGAGSILTHEVEQKLGAPQALLWGGVLLVGIIGAYILLKKVR